MNKVFFQIVFFSFISFQIIFAQDNNVPRICTGGVVNAKATYLPQPEFPQQAKDENVSSTVNVRVSIDEQGNVTSAEVCSGHPLLRDEAKKAALKATFKPTVLAGQPVKVSGLIIYKFPPSEEKVSKGGIVNGKAKYLPKPDYPQEAKDFCAEGKVAVQILMDEKGDVISAEAISGDELLRDSAVEAAKQAKFSMGHATVRTEGILIYNFVSEKKCIDGGIVNKNALSLPKSQLSNIVHPRHLKIEEPLEIRVQIIIDSSGDVVKARALNAHPLLRAPLINSARRAKFRPSLINSEPIFVRAILVYRINPNGEVDTDVENTKTITIFGHLSPDTKPIFLPQPNYPAAAKPLKLSGKISVEILIDENGNIERAKAVSGHPLLRAAAENAAKQAIYPPQTLSGIPVKARWAIVYTFNPD